MYCNCIERKASPNPSKRGALEPEKIKKLENKLENFKIKRPQVLPIGEDLGGAYYGTRTISHIIHQYCPLLYRSVRFPYSEKPRHYADEH
jgi:hypothetical protein